MPRRVGAASARSTPSDRDVSSPEDEPAQEEDERTGTVDEPERQSQPSVTASAP